MKNWITLMIALGMLSGCIIFPFEEGRRGEGGGHGGYERGDGRGGDHGDSRGSGRNQRD
jgi:hypothetical protein